MKPYSFHILVVLEVAIALIGFPNTGGTKLQRGLEKHVFGGYQAGRGQFPWQVLMEVTVNGKHFFCGGSIIGPMWVLTAAHCFYADVPRRLQFGSQIRGGHDALVQTSYQFIKHPLYRDPPAVQQSINRHDIALMKLEAPLIWSESIRPLRLPRRTQPYLREGEVVYISGWGDTAVPDLHFQANKFPHTLLYVQLQVGVIKGMDCENKGNLCTKYYTDRSMYRRDSGGAVVWQDRDGVFRQMSVNSQFFIKYNVNNEKIFALSGPFVPFYLDWISMVTGIMPDY